MADLADGGRWSRAWPILVTVLFVAVLAQSLRTIVRQRTGGAPREVLAQAARDPYRRLEARLSHPSADRHKPASIRCQSDTCPLVFSQGDLARLERAGDLRGLATAFAIEGERARALEILRGLAVTPESDNDLAALLSEDTRAWNEALERLAQALRARPGFPAALFNRGLLLERLDLPLAAARSYHAAAAAGEPGWAAEARDRAERLTQAWQIRRTAVRAAAAPEPARLASLARTINLANARAYQHLARGDAALEIKGWVLQARALVAARDGDAAIAAFDRAHALCERQLSPIVCVEAMGWHADHLGHMRKPQEARRWALEAKAVAARHGLVAEEVWANLILQTIEELRQNGGLAAAFAEETSLQDVTCTTRQTAHEYLAKLATRRGAFAEAEAEIAKVSACTPGAPPFDIIGLEVLAELLREPGRTGAATAARFDEALALRRAAPLRFGEIERADLDLIEARAKVLSEPAHARRLLSSVIQRCDGARGDAFAEIVRVQAFATLVMQDAAAGRFGPAFDLVAKWQRVPIPDRCAVALLADSGRRLVLARSAAGTITGHYRRGPASAADDSVPLPSATVASVAGCPRVAVVATPPFLGKSRLLPETLAWSYLVTGAPATLPARPRRLLVSNVEPAAALGLPRLTARLAPDARADELVEILEGQAASRENLLARLGAANQVEFHTHGLVDPEISDMPALVVSGRTAEESLLLASDLAKVSLRGRPGVILGACVAAQRASFGALARSLPMAFLHAGAAWVMASPQAIEDFEAPLFFEGVWRRIRAGLPPAVALRDERCARRWSEARSHWTREVVLFD